MLIRLFLSKVVFYCEENVHFEVFLIKLFCHATFAVVLKLSLNTSKIERTFKRKSEQIKTKFEQESPLEIILFLRVVLVFLLYKKV